MVNNMTNLTIFYNHPTCIYIIIALSYSYASFFLTLDYNLLVCDISNHINCIKMQQQESWFAGVMCNYECFIAFTTNLYDVYIKAINIETFRFHL